VSEQHQGPWLGQVQTPPEQPRRALLPALLAVALVVVVGLVIGAFLLGGPGPAAGPSPTPTPGAITTPATTPSETPAATPTRAPTLPTEPPTSAPATPSPRPGQTPAVGRPPTADIAAQIDSVVEEVPPIRQLEPRREVPYVMLSRDEFQEVLAEILEEEVDPDQLATEGRLLERLGLLPEDTDLYELLLQLYGSQVAAFYRTDTSTFYIIERDQPFGPVDRMIVAHEYTHALQDQYFDLEGTRITDPSEGDATLAQLAAIEGDASLLMFQWAFQSLSLPEQLELLTGFALTPTDQQLLEGMPPILRRQLEFPYNEGFLFATEVHNRGGWPAIDETLREPPASTEQILHPEKYFAGEAPIQVTVADPLAPLGDGWQRAYQQTMGELNIQVWLADGESPPVVFPGMPSEPTQWQAAAAGWGGDRLEMYEGPDGRWAIIWVTAWDSAADAGEFEAAAMPLLDGLGGPATMVSSGRFGGASVTLFIASDAEVLNAISSPEQPN
jgi:hypothetical protein